MNIINNKFIIKDKIGNGKFGEVYKGFNIKSKEIVAIKTESLHNKFKILKRETTILNYLSRNKIKQIPKIYWYGSFNNNTCTIMQFFSINLLEYIINNNFAQPKILHIMRECILILKNIHNSEILHRDIKPQNFMVENGEIYIIDFGLSIFFKDEDHNHIIKKDPKNITGTPRYTSYFNHNGEESSRRDDLISLGYVFMLFIFKSLSWDIYNDSDFTSQHYYECSVFHPKNIFRKKQKSINNLIDFLTSHNNLIEYFNYCYSLNFDENPDYNYLLQIL